ncbi:OLC1v1024298C1 [Oldenlandia corymbosa var. corymbosa]|uniref:OLC1v1024298C1 n=1 Tax=Oldenlandia corymbosa var. corymbosa TaxID=529605 RepID=A0AAV1C4U1_OLDCO|nr:OLC1v1024298C1 [Oldenlandia corymbosa var. corymbosa]
MATATATASDKTNSKYLRGSTDHPRSPLVSSLATAMARRQWYEVHLCPDFVVQTAIVDIKLTSNRCKEHFGGVFAVSNDHEEALSSAQFAVTQHNETQGKKIMLQSVVRASRMKVVCGCDYYLMLKGIDENGDLNV